MSFDIYLLSIKLVRILKSQSLSSRAMSFDLKEVIEILSFASLNPFRAGRCLSTDFKKEYLTDVQGLNPFRAGRCLSTFVGLPCIVFLI